MEAQSRCSALSQNVYIDRPLKNQLWKSWLMTARSIFPVRQLIIMRYGPCLLEDGLPYCFSANMDHSIEKNLATELGTQVVGAGQTGGLGG